MFSEADLIAKRAALRWLAKPHPQWAHQDLADALGMSRSWVSKWLQRLRQADPGDVMALHSRSRARHTPPASIASQPAVVQHILEIRLEPPENLQRVPGPEAILYYVHRDPALHRADVRLPRSQTTIWKILRRAGCIEEDCRHKPRPLELRQPGEEVQFDLKDASSVPADPEGKRQHVVEIANFVDAGTSIWLHREVRGDFDAETLLEAVVQFLCEHGLPRCSPLTMIHALSEALAVRDFPSALVRFLLCLGVIPNVIPPHRPDLNAYVERFHRSLGQECLQIHRPGTLSQVSELTETFLVHYNSERPNQARSCGNQPPRVACQQFPMLPRVPETVDPDRWLVQMHKHAFARTIRVGGDLTINHQDYYVSQSLSGQRVTCWLNAAEKRYGSKTFPVFMLARDGRVIADDARKVRFSMRDVAIEPDTGKPVANQVIYEYTDGAERYVLTFTREKDTLHYKFIEELHGIKALLARLIRIDGAYLRFTGELSFEHYQADMLVETHCDESLWELMYFGHVPRE